MCTGQAVRAGVSDFRLDPGARFGRMPNNILSTVDEMSPRVPAEIQRSPPLAEQIYLRLRQLIRSGALAPAERLVDSALALNLQVSRTPVREALSRLAADGLLVTHGGGFQVATLTAADMEEIFEMRRLIEPPAAAQAAHGAMPGMLDVLGQALNEARTAEKAQDFAAFVTANYAFRAAWVTQVPNGRLRESILRFDDQAGLVRSRTLVLPDARAEALALLDAMLPAFRQRDGAAVAALTDRFISAAATHFRRAAASEHPSDDSQPPARPRRRSRS